MLTAKEKNSKISENKVIGNPAPRELEDNAPSLLENNPKFSENKVIEKVIGNHAPSELHSPVSSLAEAGANDARVLNNFKKSDFQQLKYFILDAVISGMRISERIQRYIIREFGKNYKLNSIRNNLRFLRCRGYLRISASWSKNNNYAVTELGLRYHTRITAEEWKFLEGEKKQLSLANPSSPSGSTATGSIRCRAKRMEMIVKGSERQNPCMEVS